MVVPLSAPTLAADSGTALFLLACSQSDAFGAFRSDCAAEARPFLELCSGSVDWIAGSGGSESTAVEDCITVGFDSLRSSSVIGWEVVV